MLGFALNKETASIGEGYGFPTKLYPVPAVDKGRLMVPLFGVPTKVPNQVFPKNGLDNGVNCEFDARIAYPFPATKVIAVGIAVNTLEAVE